MPFTPPTTVASHGNDGYLTIFEIEQSPFGVSPPNFLAMAEMKTLTVTPIDVPEVPLTHLLSPNATEEFAPGLIKPGKVAIGGNFTGNAQQLQISQYAQTQQEFRFNIVAPCNKKTQTYTFAASGYFSHYENGPFEDNKAIEFKADIQVIGAYTETVA